MSPMLIQPQLAWKDSLKQYFCRGNLYGHSSSPVMCSHHVGRRAWLTASAA